MPASSSSPSPAATLVVTPTGALVPIGVCLLPNGADPTEAGLATMERVGARLVVRFRAPLPDPQRRRLAEAVGRETGPVRLVVFSGGWLAEDHDAHHACPRILALSRIAPVAPAFRTEEVRVPVTAEAARGLAALAGGRAEDAAEVVHRLDALGIARRAMVWALGDRPGDASAAVTVHVGDRLRWAGDGWHARAIGRPFLGAYPDLAYARRAMAALQAALERPVLRHVDAVIEGERGRRRNRYEGLLGVIPSARGLVGVSVTMPASAELAIPV
jgi:hypothetical protein